MNSFELDTSMLSDETIIKKIKKIEIPDCFTTRKLVVGDSEQTSALKDIYRQVDDIIDEETGELQEFTVTITLVESVKDL